MGMHGMVITLLGNVDPTLCDFELPIKLIIPGNHLSRFNQTARHPLIQWDHACVIAIVLVTKINKIAWILSTLSALKF